MASFDINRPFLEKPLDGDSQSDEPVQEHKGQRKIRHRTTPFQHISQLANAYFLIFIGTSLLWLAFFIAFIHFATEPSHPFNLEPGMSVFANSEFSGCGDNIAEAQNRGCKYDILSNHWMPEMCLDEEAIREYQSDASWYGYANRNRTRLISYEAMGDNPIYYTSMRDHIVHCAMLWRKQFRAFTENRQVFDSIIADTQHTMHCSQFLIDMTENGPDYRSIPISVEVGLAGCLKRR